MLPRYTLCFFARIALASCGGGTSNTVAPAEPQQTGPLTITPAKPAASGGHGPYLYALNAFGLAVYDESTNTLAQSFIVACQPGEGFKQAMFSADRSKLYILTFSKYTHYYFNVLSTTTNTFTGTIEKIPVQSIGTDMWKQNYYGVTSATAPTNFVMVDMTNQSVLSSASFPTDAFTVSAPVVDPQRDSHIPSMTKDQAAPEIRCVNTR